MNDLALLRYELKKICSGKVFWISFLLTFICVLFSILYALGYFLSDITFDRLGKYEQNYFDEMRANGNGVYSDALYQAVDSEWEQLMQESFLEDESVLHSKEGKYAPTAADDSVVLGSFHSALMTVNRTQEIRAELAESARIIREEEESLGGYGDSYLIAKAELVESCYSQPMDLTLYRLDGWNSYFRIMLNNVGYHNALAILFLVLVCGGVYAGEREKEIDALIYATYAGRLRLYLVKTAAVACICAGIVILTQASGLIICLLHEQSLEGWDAPLALISGYAQTPLNLSVWQYVLLCWFMLWLVYLLSGMAAVTVSVFARKSLTGFISAALFSIGILFYLSSLSESMGTKEQIRFEQLRTWIPFAITWTQTYFSDCDTVRIGDMPMFRITVVIGVTIGAALILFVTGGLRYCRIMIGKRGNYGTETGSHQQTIWKKTGA